MMLAAMIVLLVFSLLVFVVTSYSGVIHILSNLNNYLPPFHDLSRYMVYSWVASVLVSVTALEVVLRTFT